MTELAQRGQVSLFVDPPLKPRESQWFTPMWLAKRLASWVPRKARVLEPSCGSGNIVQALVDAGHKRERIIAVERDADWAEYARKRCKGVAVYTADFLLVQESSFDVDVVVGNFPFEGNAHLAFTLRSLEIAAKVIGVFPVSFEFSKERDAKLWYSKGVATRRARLPERVDYGGDQSPSFDSVALCIERRSKHRLIGETTKVLEEVWWP